MSKFPFFFLLALAGIVRAATTVTFPPPAGSLYGLDADQPAIVVPAFLEDTLLRSPDYEIVRFEDEDDVREGADAVVGWTFSAKGASVTVTTMRARSW